MPPPTDGETEASSHAVTCQGHGESQRDSGPPSPPASSSRDDVLQWPHELRQAGARRPPHPQLLATLKVSPRRLPHPEALTSDLPRGWESPAIGHGALTLTSVPSAGQLSRLHGTPPDARGAGAWPHPPPELRLTSWLRSVWIFRVNCGTGRATWARQGPEGAGQETPGAHGRAGPRPRRVGRASAGRPHTLPAQALPVHRHSTPAGVASAPG